MGNHLLSYIPSNNTTVTGRKCFLNSNEDFQSFIIKTLYGLGLWAIVTQSWSHDTE